MWHWFRTKIRIFSLLSLLFLSQCCCIVLPLRGQIEQKSPAVSQIMGKANHFIMDNLQAASLLKGVERLVSSQK